MARYITIHDDRIPLPMKDMTLKVEDNMDYTTTMMQLCEMFETIDEWIDNPELAQEYFYEEE